MKKLLLVLVIVFSYCSVFAQWQKTNGPAKIQNDYIKCLAINGTKIFAGAQNKGLFISTNAGNNWTKADTSMKDSFINSLAVIGGNIFAGTPSGVYISTNNGNSWTKKNQGFPGFVNPGPFAFIDTNIFVGTDSGVFLSTNKGGNWTAVNQGLTDKHVLSFAVSGKNIYAGTKSSGVFLSSNKGNFWAMINSGLTGSSVYAISISNTYIYAGTDAGLNLSTDGGNSWNLKDSGLAYTIIYSLASVGKYVFAGTFGGGVFLSNSYGKSWTAQNSGLPLYSNIYSFAMNDTTLYCGAADGNVYKRTLSNLGVVGIYEPKIEDASFTLYPNPNHGKFVIKNDHPINSIEIYNIYGERIYSNYRLNPQTSNEIDLSSFQKGIYFVRLMTTDSKSVYTEKVVIQ